MNLSSRLRSLNFYFNTHVLHIANLLVQNLEKNKINNLLITTIVAMEAFIFADIYSHFAICAVCFKKVKSTQKATFGCSLCFVSTQIQYFLNKWLQEKSKETSPSLTNNSLERKWPAWIGAKARLLSHLTVCIFSHHFPEHQLIHTADK